MSHRTALARALTALALAVVGASCSGSDAAGVSPPPTSLSGPLVVSIAPRLDTITVGASKTLSAQVTAGGVPRTASVEWSSTNPSVASVTNGLVTGVSVGSASIVARAGTAADTATIVIAAGRTMLVVSPSAVYAALGDTIQFHVSTITATGASASLANVTWSVSDSSAAQMVGAGALATLSEGTVEVTARVGNDEASASVKVMKTPVASMTISPSTASLVAGETATLVATLYDSRGRETSHPVTWSSSHVAIATVDHDGILTSKQAGGAIITATSGSRSASATVNVSSPPAASVTLSFPSDTLGVSRTMQASATAYDASGKVLTGRPMAWQSSNPSVATIGSSGVITGMVAGQTTISVIVDGLIASRPVRVSSGAPASVTIVPGSANVLLAQATQLAAEVRDQSGNLLGTQTVTWSSQATSIATVSGGKVTGVSLGTAGITASVGSITGSASVTVQNTPVASVSVAPASASVEVGKTISLVATTRDANGNILHNRPVSWSSSSASTASVSTQGLVSGVAAGTATITATVEGKSATSAITVAAPPPAPVASVVLSLSSSAINVGQTSQAVALLYDANGALLSGRPVSFSSVNPTIATVSSSGLVTAIGGGTVVISATAEGKTGNASLTVSVATSPVATVTLSAPNTSLVAGDSTQLVVQLRDASGNLLSGRTISYGTSNPTVATVSATGVVRALAAGPATISATSEGKSASLAFSVSAPAPSPAPVASVTVSLSSSTVAVGGGTQASVMLRDANGNVLTGRTISWTSANASVATVSQSGYVSGVAAGSSAISATSEGKSGSATVTVQAPTSVVATVKVALGSSSLAVGNTTQATATALDSKGVAISGRTVKWTISGGTNVASVGSSTTATTTVTANTAGSTSVVATIDGIAGSAGLTVTQPTSSPVALPKPIALLNFQYPSVTGKSWAVKQGDNLQTVLNNAQRGDEIVIDAGATFTGNFTLPVKAGTSSNGWIVIRSSASSQLPARGNRVGPANAPQMPKIVTPNTAPALRTDPSTNGWWITGVEFTSVGTTTGMIYRVVQLGASGTSQNTLAQVPYDLVLDRVYIHPQPHQNNQRCVELNSARTQITDSYLYDCHAKGYDSQAIIGWNGPGPFKIVNNMLAGAGENVMFGGADPAIKNLIPGDVELRRNYFYTPTSWKGVWTKKNLFETKNVVRMLIEENVFDGSWSDGQTGIGLVLKVSNQSGSCTWCAVTDLTIRNNIIRNVGGGIAIMGITSAAGNPVGQLLSRVLIENNIIENVNTGAFTGESRIITMMNNAQDITIRQNTMTAPGAVNMFLNLATNPAATNFVFENNIITHGTYGFFSSWFQVGENSLQAFRGTVSMKNYVMIGNQRSGYPNGTFVSDYASAVATGRGANIAAVQSAVQGVAKP